MKDYEKRRAEQAARANAAVAPGARTFKLAWVSLDTAVGDDAPLKAKVLEYEPGYAAPH
jgi:hypothetical protein